MARVSSSQTGGGGVVADAGLQQVVVAADGEGAARAGNEHGTHVGIGGEVEPDAAGVGVHDRGQRVELVGAVEGDDGDPLAVLDEDVGAVAAVVHGGASGCVVRRDSSPKRGRAQLRPRRGGSGARIGRR